MAQQIDPTAIHTLESLLKKTKEVRILARYTDLTCQIKEMVAQPTIGFVPKMIKNGILTIPLEQDEITLYLKDGVIEKQEPKETVALYPQVGATLMKILFDFSPFNTFTFLFQEQEEIKKVTLNGTQEMGGSELYLDHQLVRKDGYFVDPKFFSLNSNQE